MREYEIGVIPTIQKQPLTGEALARKSLEKIKADPAAWDQKVWLQDDECGTVGCIAGWATVLSGDVSQLVLGERKPRNHHLWDRSSTYQSARRLLELSEEQAARLFSTDNSLADIERLIDEFYSKKAQPDEESKTQRARSAHGTWSHGTW